MFLDNIEIHDFACQDFRWFNDVEYSKQFLEENKDKPEIMQYCGTHVLRFFNIQDLNTTIQQLTLLRDSINTQAPKHQKIYCDFYKPYYL